MLFRLVDHYNIELDECNKKLESVECLICYDIIFEDELNPIKLNSNTKYIKYCKCDIFIHKKSQIPKHILVFYIFYNNEIVIFEGFY